MSKLLTPGLNSTLSLSARLLLILGLPTTILLTSLFSPTAALLTPLSFTPSLYLYHKWRIATTSNPAASPRNADLEPLIWTGLLTGTIGLLSAAALQLAICKLTILILFGSNFHSTPLEDKFLAEFQRATIQGLSASELSSRALIAASWQNWAFNTVLTFVAAGFVEEGLKYIPVLYARRLYRDENLAQTRTSTDTDHGDEVQEMSKGSVRGRARDRAYVDFALAGALGFSLIEALGFIYGSCTQDSLSWGMLVLTVLERVVGQIGHLSIAALTGVRATKRDFYGVKMRWWEVIGPSVLLHGLSNCIVMGASALEGNVGWIHPTGGKMVCGMVGAVAVVWGVAVNRLWREWNDLDKLDIALVREKKALEKDL